MTADSSPFVRPDGVTRREVPFTSQGVRLWGVLFEPAAGSALAGADGKVPCIVMAHGLGGVFAAGLEPFAVKFAQAGIAVLGFDYRGFGQSDGAPRQVVDVSMQLQDWGAAIAVARGLEGVDSERIGLWGSSFSGGLVVTAARRDGRVAAVSSQGAMLDGLAASLFLARAEGPLAMARLLPRILKDALAARLGRPRVMLPVVGAPGSGAVLSSPGAVEGYLALTPPDWRNEITISWILTLGLWRPNLDAEAILCPLLVCVTERDNIVPPSAMADAARRAGARAEVKRYPIGHFDIYVGSGFERAVADQVEFFGRHLAAKGV